MLNDILDGHLSREGYIAQTCDTGKQGPEDRIMKTARENDVARLGSEFLAHTEHSQPTSSPKTSPNPHLFPAGYKLSFI